MSAGNATFSYRLEIYLSSFLFNKNFQIIIHDDASCIILRLTDKAINTVLKY